MSETVPRRTFLASAAAAAGSLLALPAGTSLAADAAEKPADFNGLPVGIQTYTLRNFDTQQAIRHIQLLGLRFAELYSKHLATTASADEIAAVREQLSAAGIRMNAHGVHSFTADHAQNRQLFEFAKAAGIGTITANPQHDAFDSLDKLVEEYQIRIAIHNHGPGALYDGLNDVQTRVKNRHPLVGACVDTGHVLRSNQDPVEWVEKLGPRVYALHIKDVAEKQAKTHDVVIGRGHLRVEPLFRTLKEIGFPSDGVISIEYEANPQNPIADVKACLDVARETIAKVWS